MLKDDDVRKGIQKLDRVGNNQINWKLFLNSMILLDASLIQLGEEELWKERLKANEVDLEAFINV